LHVCGGILCSLAPTGFITPSLPTHHIHISHVDGAVAAARDGVALLQIALQNSPSSCADREAVVPLAMPHCTPRSRQIESILEYCGHFNLDITLQSQHHIDVTLKDKVDA